MINTQMIDNIDDYTELEQTISIWKEKREETIHVLVSLFERLDKHIEDNSKDWIDRDKWRILEEARYIALLTQDIDDFSEEE